MNLWNLGRFQGSQAGVEEPWHLPRLQGSKAGVERWKGILGTFGTLSFYSFPEARRLGWERWKGMLGTFGTLISYYFPEARRLGWESNLRTLGPWALPRFQRFQGTLGLFFSSYPPGAESRVGAMSDLSPGLKLPLFCPLSPGNKFIINLLSKSPGSRLRSSQG